MDELSSVTQPRLRRLTLTDFRNHVNTRLTLAGDACVLTGPNGAGKTNILEAVSLLSPGRGLRRARYADMIRQGAEGGFAVGALLEREADDEPVRIGTGLADADAGTRDVRFDGEPARSGDSLSDYLTVLWLTPAMDGLFTGPASDRRRFFDRMVMALHPGHGRASSAFERAMRARNKLFDDNVRDPVWFAGVEAPMAEAALAIHESRMQTLALLQKAIEPMRTSGGPFPHAVIDLTGFEDAADYRERLASNRARDAAAGRALDGPHRVELSVRHGPKDVEARLASTGEQKALLIGLILAQAQLVSHERSQAPVLLFDEIAAHLDEERRRALFALTHGMGAQTFMTGTDTHLFDDVPGFVDRFHVDGGTVQEGQ